MSQNVNVNEKELDSAPERMRLLVQKMSKRENDERENLTKRYTSQDKRAASEYERGFTEGLTIGQEIGYAAGWDAAMKQSAQEQEQKEEEEKEEPWGKEKREAGDSK